MDHFPGQPCNYFTTLSTKLSTGEFLPLPWSWRLPRYWETFLSGSATVGWSPLFWYGAALIEDKCHNTVAFFHKDKPGVWSHCPAGTGILRSSWAKLTRLAFLFPPRRNYVEGKRPWPGWKKIRMTKYVSGKTHARYMSEIPAVSPRPVTVYQGVKSLAQQRNYTQFLLAKIPPTLKTEYKTAFWQILPGSNSSVSESFC